MLLPFNPDLCIYKLHLLLCDQPVILATDSARIHEILNDTYTNVYFNNSSDTTAPVYYCCTNCDAPFDLAITCTNRVYLAQADTTNPGKFKLFHWDNGLISAAGFFAPEENETDEVPDAVLELFCTHFQRRIIADVLNNKKSVQLIHAGAVCEQDKGLLILAGSRGGKSTLTIACVMSGMGYLSDDLMTVDLATGMLLPFPRAIRLRAPSCNLIPGLRDYCNGLTIDARGETRYYLDIQQIGPHAQGYKTPLTHVVIINGFGTEPMIDKVSLTDVCNILTQADCFASGHEALELMWQWGETLQHVKCAGIIAGAPLETAAALQKWMCDTT